jgi:uncharacterized protein YggE
MAEVRRVELNFVGAIFFVSISASIVTIACAAPVLAQQPQAAPVGELQARIIVTGEGSISVPPDYAEVSGGATTRGKSVKEAADDNSKLMTDITNALLQAGIARKDIQTSHFSIRPIYTQTDPHAEAKLAGYEVGNQVNVKIREIRKAGDVLERLIAAGATNVGNIEFLQSEPSKALDQAREAAVADARRKAELYAKAAGLTLGRVAWITEETGYPPSPMPMAARMGAAAPAAPVPISAGEDILHTRITVGFNLIH